ncbi:major facilitator superfamily domain-containing protein [Stachybotrys elegans]|uniref:Major facilitator superfamily domain-containing protein n=1 Tax=Stachybotrys elegans TaxID=80388 RepID=A0A8K0WL16_9HYPO|nr:major facilitator superfamily domain-containing protein [Stachybotrys elegans]
MRMKSKSTSEHSAGKPPNMIVNGSNTLQPEESAPEGVVSRQNDGYDKMPRNKRRLIVFLVSWCGLLSPLSSTAVLSAIPEVTETYNTTASMVGVSNALYLVFMGLSPLFWGPLNRVYGRRWTSITTSTLFTLSSIATALGPNFASFFAFRIFMAFTGTSFLVTGPAVIGDLYHPPEVQNLKGLPKGQQVKAIWSMSNPVRVLEMAVHPNLTIAAVANGANVWNMYGMLTPIRYVLNPRFGLTSPTQSGLFFLAPGLGYLVGTLFGGRWSDYTTKKWIEKRHGTRIPEDRLRSCLPFLGLAMPASTLVYGWTVQEHAGGIPAPVIAMFLGGVAQLFCNPSINTYCLDAMPDRGAESLAWNFFVRYMFGAVASAVVIPAITAIGVGYVRSQGHNNGGASFITMPIDPLGHRWRSQGVTQDEKQILQFIAHGVDALLRRETDPDWHQRLYETCGLSPAERRSSSRRAELFQVALQELQVKANDPTANGIHQVLDAEFQVLLSDSIVPAAVRRQLSMLAEKQDQATSPPWDVWCYLPNQDVLERDWWGVQNTLTPLTYPATRDETRSIEFGEIPLEGCWRWVGQGTCDNTNRLLDSYVDLGPEANPMQYRLLPSQVEVRDDGSVKIASYINGLHYRVLPMYKVLEDLLQLVIPLWDRAVGSIGDSRRITLDEAFIQDYVKKLRTDGSDRPQPAVNAPARPQGKTGMVRGKTSLQIIFQMETFAADTIFPESVRKQAFGVNYSRGNWIHPGPFGEKVVAVCLYCYSMGEDEEDFRLELIQDTSLDLFGKFMEAAMDSDTACQAYNDLFEGFQDTTQDESSDDELDDTNDPVRPCPLNLLGSIRMRPGRLVVFPATADYRIKLPDEFLQLGLLSMWLIDPQRPSNLSTANVPPQSRDYWLAHVRDIPWFQRLPEELWGCICDEIDHLRAVDQLKQAKVEEYHSDEPYPLSRKAAHRKWEDATSNALRLQIDLETAVRDAEYEGGRRRRGRWM